MEIIFCKQCGRRIKQDELQTNQVTIVEGAHFCTTCMPITQSIPGPNDPRRKSSAIIRPKTTSQSAVVRNKTGRVSAVDNVRPPMPHPMPSFKPKQEKKPPMAVYAGVAVGVLALIIVGLMFALKSPPPPPPHPQDPPHPDVADPRVPPPGDHGVPGIPPPIPGAVNPAIGGDSAELAALLDTDIDNAIRDSQKGPRPKLVCSAVPAAPTLDGDLNDPCWNGATVLDNFTADLTGRPAAETAEATTVKVVHCQGVLYIAGEADVPEGTDKMAAGMVNRDDSLWDEESIEIFLTPPTSKMRYAQLIVNPRGAVADTLGRLNEGRELKVNFPSLKAASKIAANKWTFELAINATDFNGILAGRWQINANRNRVPQGGPHKYQSYKIVGRDYHAWVQHDGIEFNGETAADLDKAHDEIRKNLPEYTAWRKWAAAEKTRPLPFDSVDITPKNRAVLLPICPAFTMQESGAAFDSPIGSTGYFGANMTLKPDNSEVGLLRMGNLTAGTAVHIHLSARTNGGNTEQPRVFGLVFRSASGMPQKLGLIGVSIVDGQAVGFAETRAAGAPVSASNGLVPIVTLANTARPLELDYCIEPERVRLFVNGRAFAEMPWPSGAKTAADLLGLFVQNSGLDLYQLLITPGLVDKTIELPPYGQVAYAPALAGFTANATPSTPGLELMPGSSAAQGLSLGVHGKPVVAEADFAANPATDFKLPVHGEVPYRMYARIRTGGSGPGQTAPKFLLQVGNQADAAQAAYAPKMAAAYQFQRLTTNSHDWGWVVLTAPAIQKPVSLIFTGDTDAAFRLIAATPDTLIDQVLLLPAEQPCRGLEINDDSWYVGGSVPLGFDLKSLQKPVLADATSVRVSAFRIDETPPVAGTATIPNPTALLTGTGSSADGFISQSSVATMRWVKAADGMGSFTEMLTAKLAVPPLLLNAHVGLASHTEWAASSGAAFQFTLNGDAMVFVAYDPAVPASKAMIDELITDGFERSTLLISQSQPTAMYQVLRRRFPSGPVRFLHNLAGAPPLLFVMPADTTPRPQVDMSVPLATDPGLPADSYVAQLRADDKDGFKDIKKALTGSLQALHRVDIVPETAIGKPAWAFYGIPESQARVPDPDSSYVTLEDNPALSRKEGAISCWVYLGGSNSTTHVLMARKMGTIVKTLEIVHGGMASNFGAGIARAKTQIPSYKWTLVVWNFGPTGQQFIIDGKVEDVINLPVDLSAGGEIRIGNDYKKNGLEGFVAEFGVHNRMLDAAQPMADLPPALKLNMAMEKITEPGAVAVYGFDSTSLPKEIDLSGNGLDAAWDKYKGAVVTGQSVAGSADRVANIKRGLKENPLLVVPADPRLLLPSGSIFFTVTLDKTAIKRAAGDANRCLIVEQASGNAVNSVYLGDTLTDGFFFASLSSKPAAAVAAAPMVRSRTDLEGGISYRVAFTWTPQKVRLYQNGQLIDEKPNTGFSLDGKTKSLVFFGKDGDASRGFVGTISQLKLLNFARSIWE